MEYTWYPILYTFPACREQHPNQFGIINALRIKTYGGCRMARQSQVMRVDLARRLS